MPHVTTQTLRPLLCFIVLMGCGAPPEGEGSDAAQDAPCGPTAPMGACAAGDLCRGGICLDEEVFCGPSRPSGLCIATDERCVDAACVPEADLCSPEEPNGLCPAALQCINGSCASDAPCGPSTPDGYCETVTTICVDGACIPRDAGCTTENPTGQCPSGQTCLDGVCLESSDPRCTPDSPTGTCASGETCAGGVCRASQAPPSCSDGALNFGETDVDCGGSRCDPCGDLAMCDTAWDCRSLRCEGGRCLTGTPSYEVDEDFETGDLSKFPYVLSSSPADEDHWEIEDEATACHAGLHCMRTSVLHEAGQLSQVSLPLSVREDAMVRFWVRTDTEEGEHVFRFFVDDTLVTELSGVHDWMEVAAPVARTGAGGPDRVLRWEYERSSFLNPDRPPRNTVWIDDVDMPPWNTQPSVPRLLAPGNGMVIQETAPRFRWRSLDPDFDRIVYEMQFDVDPEFPAPESTGETFELTWQPTTPLAADTIYYWRVRSKDESDYRWSAWSPTSTVHVTSGGEYSHRFRQDTAAEFALDSATGVLVDDLVSVDSSTFQTTTSISTSSEVTLTNLPTPRSGAAGTFAFRGSVRTQWDSSQCGYSGFGRFNLTINGATTRRMSLGGQFIQCQCTDASGSVLEDNLTTHLPDGSSTMTVAIRPTTGWQSTTCGAGQLTLSYPTAGTGSLTSVPIWLDTFGGAGNWEKVSFLGSDNLRVQVLDANQEPIPEAQIPGNTEGLAPGTHMLFNLDSASHPVLYLRANLADDAWLDWWEVYADDGYRWHFGNADDAEGWVPGSDEGTLTHEVRDGVLRINGGIDVRGPGLEYRMPAAVDAARFTELVVRMRTSNTNQNDTVVLYWENNFGFFDAVRSLEGTGFFAVMHDQSLDLTAVPPEPKQPFQGQITALRINPVEGFVDAAGDPAPGWVELDSIWLR